MDVGDQPEVDQVPVTRLFGLLDLLVVGRLGHLQDPEQERDREAVTVFVNERHDRRRVGPSSDAK